MQTRQWKREKESKIVEAARAALYHELLMREQRHRLIRLTDEDEKLINLGNFLSLASTVDIPTEALTISGSTIREALWPSRKGQPAAEEA